MYIAMALFTAYRRVRVLPDPGQLHLPHPLYRHRDRVDGVHLQAGTGRSSAWSQHHRPDPGAGRAPADADTASGLTYPADRALPVLGVLSCSVSACCSCCGRGRRHLRRAPALAAGGHHGRGAHQRDGGHARGRPDVRGRVPRRPPRRSCANSAHIVDPPTPRWSSSTCRTTSAIATAAWPRSAGTCRPIEKAVERLDEVIHAARRPRPRHLPADRAVARDQLAGLGVARPEDGPRLVVAGSWGADYYAPIGPADGELEIVKHRHSGFVATALDLACAAWASRRSSFGGVASTCCVEATAPRRSRLRLLRGRASATRPGRPRRAGPGLRSTPSAPTSAGWRESADVARLWAERAPASSSRGGSRRADRLDGASGWLSPALRNIDPSRTYPGQL